MKDMFYRCTNCNHGQELCVCSQDLIDEGWSRHNKNQLKAELLDKLVPFIDKNINLLKMKIALGMASSYEADEFTELQKILPNILGVIQ